MLAAVVSAGGDRAVAVTTIAFQYFGMHVFFICVLNVYFMVDSVVHGWVRNIEIKMINQSNQSVKMRRMMLLPRRLLMMKYQVVWYCHVVFIVRCSGISMSPLYVCCERWMYNGYLMDVWQMIVTDALRVVELIRSRDDCLMDYWDGWLIGDCHEWRWMIDGNI